MQAISDPIDVSLLDNWQRDFPICHRPFDTLADTLGITGQDVLDRLTKMKASGRITRIGATCTPNSVSASTLAAVAAPEERIDEVAAVIGAQAGVNHSYLREDKWNLWFVATGPDRAHVDATLARIGAQTGLEVIDLRLVRPFNVDLGFRMVAGKSDTPHLPKLVDMSVLADGDRALMQELCRGLAISETPYEELATRLNRDETDVAGRIAVLQTAGIIARFGVIVRHRTLGWSANAMVVWDVDPETIDKAGPALTALTGVTLCYERQPAPGKWPYRLYNMIHARSRAEAMAVLKKARALPELAGADHKVLFSTQCYKQTGALIAVDREAAA